MTTKSELNSHPQDGGPKEIVWEEAATSPLLEAIRDQIAWLQHYLTQLVHVSTKDEHGYVVNGFAAAQIPDWAIRQKLDNLEGAIKEAGVGAQEENSDAKR